MDDLEQIARVCGNARKQGQGWMCSCPAHDDKTPSLSINTGREGNILLYCHSGCSYLDIINSLNKDIDTIPLHRTIYTKKKVNNFFYPLAQEKSAKSANSAKDGTNTSSFNAKKVLMKTLKINDTPVEKYLKNRGIVINQDVSKHLHYNPSCWHTEQRRSFPCMIAEILLLNEIIGVHRTYLTTDGYKADTKPYSNKKILGGAKRGAVPFGTIEDIVILAEGIETALSLYVMYQKPVWATLNATNMCQVVLPKLPLAQTVYIAQDNDESGRKGTDKTAMRLYAEGRRVIIMNTPPNLNDFNDLLLTGETHGKQLSLFQ